MSESACALHGIPDGSQCPVCHPLNRVKFEGFTREDIAALTEAIVQMGAFAQEHCVSSADYDECHRQQERIQSIADRIEALLPPEG